MKKNVFKYYNEFCDVAKLFKRKEPKKFVILQYVCVCVFLCVCECFHVCQKDSCWFVRWTNVWLQYEVIIFQKVLLF